MMPVGACGRESMLIFSLQGNAWLGQNSIFMITKFYTKPTLILSPKLPIASSRLTSSSLPSVRFECRQNLSPLLPLTLEMTLASSMRFSLFIGSVQQKSSQFKSAVTIKLCFYASVISVTIIHLPSGYTNPPTLLLQFLYFVFIRTF